MKTVDKSTKPDPVEVRQRAQSVLALLRALPRAEARMLLAELSRDRTRTARAVVRLVKAALPRAGK